MEQIKKTVEGLIPSTSPEGEIKQLQNSLCETKVALAIMQTENQMMKIEQFKKENEIKQRKIEQQNEAKKFVKYSIVGVSIWFIVCIVIGVISAL